MILILLCHTLLDKIATQMDIDLFLILTCLTSITNSKIAFMPIFSLCAIKYALKLIISVHVTFLVATKIYM